MITRPEDIHFDVSRSASEHTESPVPDAARALIGVLNAAGAATGSPSEIAEQVLEAISSEFGTSGCHLVTLSTTADGIEALTPLASSGQYGSLLRDMPPIELDSPLEAARVLESRTPRFVDALHIPAVPDEQAEPTRDEVAASRPLSDGSSSQDRDLASSPQRWRSMIATQSYAVLPIVLAGEPLGVLTMQWSKPVEFDRSLIRALESLATLISLTVKAAMVTSGLSPNLDESTSSAIPQRTQSLALTAFGPALDDGGTEPYTVLVGTLDLSHEGDVAFVHLAPHAQGPSMPVTTPARMLVVAPAPGQDAADEEASDSGLPEALSALATAVVRLSDSPREWLETINRSIPRSAAEAGFSAWGARFDPVTGALVESSAGITSTLVTTGAGEEQHTDHSKLPLGLWAEESYEERARLLLPGDTLEVCLDEGPDLTLGFITRAP